MVEVLPGGTKENLKKKCQNSHCPGWDSNQALPSTS